MPNKVSARVLVSLAIAVSSIVLIAAPVSAETVLNACHGTCGAYQYTDTGPTGGKGAVCGYETVSHDLDFISVRPPLMHGPFANNTPVAWQYKIWRAPVNTGVFALKFTSTWQGAKANDQIPAYADHGFARRFWTAPEDPHGYFKVRVYLRWKNNAGTVIGTASAEYDWYKTQWNGTSSTNMQYCLEDF